MNWWHQITGDLEGLVGAFIVWGLLRWPRFPAHGSGRDWLLWCFFLGGVSSLKQAFFNPSLAARLYHGVYVLGGLIATLIALKEIHGSERPHADR